METANSGSDTFKMLLTTSSYTPAASDSVISDIDNEVSGNGYARFEHTATSAQTSGTYTFDLDNATFTADSGSIVARYYVIYDDSLANDPLVCYGLLDETPADVTTTDTNTLTVTVNASGLFTIA